MQGKLFFLRTQGSAAPPEFLNNTRGVGMRHRIINVVTGVRPRELIFESRESAETWLSSYGVSEEYKQLHYRIVPV
jgi:hypothetical protein